MFNWQVQAILGVALLTVIAGLLILAIPNAQEGPVVLQLDTKHSLCIADVVGLGVSAAGIATAWITGFVWERRRRW